MSWRGVSFSFQQQRAMSAKAKIWTAPPMGKAMPARLSGPR